MSAVGADFKYTGEAIWKVLIASVILGAGLPALFAAGVRSLAWGRSGQLQTTSGETVDGTPSGGNGNIVGVVIAVILFVIVAYAIASGLVYIIATGKGSSYDITFKHVIPEIYKKS